MKQVLQDIRSGDLAVHTVPPPALQAGMVRVRTAASVISGGTEKMLIDLARKSLLGKARARPDLVQQVAQKVRKEGLASTYRNVMSKLQRPMPLGYSAAGIVEEVGATVDGIQVGDRVAIAGAGYANHAEINCVPKNLVARIPNGVSFEEAGYTTICCIALQGVRLARPELGETAVVVGLGLIGLVAVQLLKANGCRVIGVDLDPEKVKLAHRLGLDAGVVSSHDDPIHELDRLTGGRGADRTLITAATNSNEPIEMAGHITRRKGEIVVVGGVGMHIPRDLYYYKELGLKISMSYGPGRYDPSYEEGGIDYPYDYVRWTEQRNMEAVLDLMARKSLDVTSLTTHRFAFTDALEAYGLVQNTRQSYVGIVLEYDVEKEQENVLTVARAVAHERTDRLGIAVVGAGNYAAVHLLPHLKKDPAVRLVGLVTATGLSAKQRGEEHGFEYCTTDLQPVIDDDSVGAVIIASRHSTHADFTIRALTAGKHVFVEKPMVVTPSELSAVRDAYEAAWRKRPTGLMVGLNRRFAPLVSELKKRLPRESAKQMLYRVNAGPVATTSWLHDPREGGGMLVGEMCHFIDLMQFLAEERPVSVFARALKLTRHDSAEQDNLSIVVSFDGGSVGTLCYSTVGDRAASKERLEIFGGGTAAILDDFRLLEITNGGSTIRRKVRRQDKGQAAEIAATVGSFRETGSAPIPFDQLVSVMEVIFAARRSLASGEPVDIPAHVMRSVEVNSYE